VKSRRASDDDTALLTLIRYIVAGDTAAVTRSLVAAPALASAPLRQHGASRRSAHE
jgi:replication-associated recombination protein RarA